MTENQRIQIERIITIITTRSVMGTENARKIAEKFILRR